MWKGFKGCCDCDRDDNRVGARGSESLTGTAYRYMYFGGIRAQNLLVPAGISLGIGTLREYVVNQGLTECTEGNYRNKVG